MKRYNWNEKEKLLITASIKKTREQITLKTLEGKKRKEFNDHLEKTVMTKIFPKNK